MTMKICLNHQNRILRRHRLGLVLLVVLGMLALFTLLAISYLSISGQSRMAGQAIVRASIQRVPMNDFDAEIIRKIVRGDTDNQSAMYGHSLLEDVFGRDPIQGTFLVNVDPSDNTNPDRHSVQLNAANGNRLLRVQLNSNIQINQDPFRSLNPADQESSTFSRLSVEDDIYTGRLITFLEGPLANQTYRILSYIGFPGPIPRNGATPSPLEHAIVIDLDETKEPLEPYTRPIVGSPTGETETLRWTLNEWIANSPNAFPFISEGPLATARAFRYIINDVPFSGLGYGVERDPGLPTYGNLDQSRLVPPNFGLPNPGTPTGNSVTGYTPGQESFPIALLPHYDYLKKETTSGALGSSRIAGPDPTLYEVTGSTNEGFDVADYHDYFLAHVPELIDPQTNLPINRLNQGLITPSFHRPELINYIAQYFNQLTNNSITAEQLVRMIQLIDYACARPLSYRIVVGANNEIVRNQGFTGRNDVRAIPALNIDVVSNLAGSINQTREWVRALVGGGATLPTAYAWDVDNDGDGVADSVWVDPNLPYVNAPNGKRLKVLAANLILDMDGRINVNLGGDAYLAGYFQSPSAYQTSLQAGSDQTFMRNSIGSVFSGQGLGYGPADISLARLFGTNTPNVLQLRYGADNVAGLPGQAPFGQFFRQREIRFGSNGFPYGLAQSRRGRMGYGIDRFGNVRMSDSVVSGTSNDLVDDAYEVNGTNQTEGDFMFTLTEMEALLRRYDSDASNLPDRIKRQIPNYQNLNDAIYSAITTRSVEMRHPPMAAVAMQQRVYAKPGYPTNPLPYPRRNSSDNTLLEQPVPAVTTPGIGTPPRTVSNRLISNSRNEGSLLRFIQMLYDERYPNQPTLNLSDIRVLFPLEFRKGLRLDINRAFGNGFDDDGDGLIDEPQELASLPQLEQFPNPLVPGGVLGEYSDNLLPPSAAAVDPNLVQRYITPNLSRKMMARQLYCLAQLLVAPDYAFPGVVNPSTDPILYRRIRARELAQWAVNVVDFRDTDSVMTRFEYDETPFQVDTADGDTIVWNPKRDNVVWGMEFPDVLMTETLAFHDKRVKDTDDDNGEGTRTDAGTNPDNDYDQYRIPQGSAFIELFNPRSTLSPTTPNTVGATDLALGAAPSDLYDLNGDLQLSRIAPSSTGLAMPASLPPAIDYGAQPVFRIGIARFDANQEPAYLLSQARANPAAMQQVANRTQQTSNTPIGISPGAPSAFDSSGLTGDISIQPTPTGANQIKFDRIVWFTGTTVQNNQSIPDLLFGEDPANGRFIERQHRVFRNANAGATLTLPGGSYLVVGPRDDTPIGSLNDGIQPPNYTPSLQRIRLQPGSVTFTDLNGASAVPGWSFKAPQTMIAVTEPPNPSWLIPAGGFPAPLVGGVGFNISEPTAAPGRYYTLPTRTLNPGANPLFPRTDSYADIAAGEQTLPDTPFDYDQDPLQERLGAEIDQASGQRKSRLGTYAGHRTAFLQRLADPDQPYHPVFNPYITIDWMSMDLTVFNGEDIANSMFQEETSPTGQAAYAFQSRYKDGARSNETPVTSRSVATAAVSQRFAYFDPSIATGEIQTGATFFSSSTAELLQSQPGTAGGTQPYFPYVIGVANPLAPIGGTCLSLGFLNGGRQDAAGRYDGFGPPAVLTGNYQGAPQHPQAGMFWLNRPFTNPFELLLVPRTAPGQLGVFYTMPKEPDNGARYDFVSPRPQPLPTPYGHLPAFFSANDMKVQAAAGTAPYNAHWQQANAAGGPTGSAGSDWNLLLELIETASPYPDSEKRIDPAYLTGNAPLFRPFMLGGITHYGSPFNALPRYRTFGKVNINTISNRAVWEAIEWNIDIGARNVNSNKWFELKKSRRGYNTATTPIANSFLSAAQFNPLLDPFAPSQFRNAYKNAFAANVDVINQPYPSNPPPAPAAPRSPQMMRNNRSVNVGLLQAAITNWNTINTDQTLNQNTPLMNIDLVSTGSTNPLIVGETTRQPFLNYQRAMRLPNLVTNQSNVFAVWITVGLFEYDEATGLGQEYIGPSGVPERSKSFYLVDRSIPVGFAPGRQYNSDRTILHRSRIP